MRKFLLGLVCGLVVVGVANMGHAFSLKPWSSGNHHHKGKGFQISRHDDKGTVNPIAVPEPATFIFLGVGLIGLASFGRKNFKK